MCLYPYPCAIVSCVVAVGGQVLLPPDRSRFLISRCFQLCWAMGSKVAVFAHGMTKQIVLLDCTHRDGVLHPAVSNVDGQFGCLFEANCLILTVRSIPLVLPIMVVLIMSSFWKYILSCDIVR